MKIAIGNDHAAVNLKWEMVKYLEGKGHTVLNVGTDTAESMSYAVSGYRVARLVAGGEADCGVLICGTGVGISMAANKVHGVRACVCSEPVTAHLSKLHNNANVVAFGERIVGLETAKAIVDAFLDTEYEGGRHQARVDMLSEIETTQDLRAAH